MGFETVVRPVVFPNIRPPPARALSIQDAPDKGLAVITGGSANVVDLPYSAQSGWNARRSVEVKRHYQKVRMYYTRPDGTIDYSKYWEFEVLKSIEFRENGRISWGAQFMPFQEAENVSVLEDDLIKENRSGQF